MIGMGGVIDHSPIQLKKCPLTVEIATIYERIKAFVTEVHLMFD